MLTIILYFSCADPVSDGVPVNVRNPPPEAGSSLHQPGPGDNDPDLRDRHGPHPGDLPALFGQASGLCQSVIHFQGGRVCLGHPQRRPHGSLEQDKLLSIC